MLTIVSLNKSLVKWIGFHWKFHLWILVKYLANFTRFQFSWQNEVRKQKLQNKSIEKWVWSSLSNQLILFFLYQYLSFLAFTGATKFSLVWHMVTIMGSSIYTLGKLIFYLCVFSPYWQTDYCGLVTN